MSRASLDRTTRSTFLPFMASLSVAGVWIMSTTLPESTLIAVVILAIAATFTAERQAPYDPTWNINHGDRSSNIVHAFVNETSAAASLAALPLVARHATLADIWPSGWPFGFQVLAAVLVADFGITVAHWLSHKIGWLWRLHAVHHSAPRFYGFNGLMKHPLHQALELAAGVAPLILVGLPPRVAAALALCVVIQLLLQHANVNYSVGPVGPWLALNRAHRFHHVSEAAKGDVNFGLFTTIWDRWLLHTYVFEPSRAFTTSDLGVTGRPDYPTRYIPQLIEPFRSDRG